MHLTFGLPHVRAGIKGGASATQPVIHGDSARSRITSAASMASIAQLRQERTQARAGSLSSRAGSDATALVGDRSYDAAGGVAVAKDDEGAGMRSRITSTTSISQLLQERALSRTDSTASRRGMSETEPGASSRTASVSSRSGSVSGKVRPAREDI